MREIVCSKMHRSWVGVAACVIALTSALGAAAASGCGSFHAEDEPSDGGATDSASADSSDPDGGAGVDGGGDSSTPARKCSPTAMFEAPVPVTWAGTPTPFSSVRGPAVDGLTYVTKGDGSGAKLGAFAVAANETTSTEASGKIDSVNSAGGGDEQATVTDDALTLWFMSPRATATKKLWRATRTTVAETFSSPVHVSVKADGATEEAADVFQDPYVVGNRLFFVYEKSGVSAKARTICTGPATGADPIPAGCIKLANPSNDEHPVVSADGEELFFDRDGPNNTEMYRAVKQGTGFGTPERIRAVEGSDFKPTWISPDACTLYFFEESAGVTRLLKQTRK